jgi:hypothetical protein
MSIDLKNNLTWTSMLASKSQATNNTASAGLDLQAYEGTLAVRVNLGVKTVGDNDGAVTVVLQDSATNAASAATNVSGATVATTNNTAASGTILVDPRARLRYLFARIILSGTNTPTYPISVEATGIKQVQP